MSTSNGFASKQFLIILACGLIVLAAVGGAAYFYTQYQKSLVKAPSQAQEAQSVVDEVGKLIVLPAGEKPQIAVVSDVNKLSNQAFFAMAKNGDKVLIYTKAQKAILYDPVAKKVVEVGPINLTQASSSASSSSAVSPTGASVRVALYNGTTTAGLTVKIQNSLEAKLPTIKVTKRQNADKSTYKKTVVVDLTGKQSAAAGQIAKELKGEVGSLPAGEEKPDSIDIVVILGQE